MSPPCGNPILLTFLETWWHAARDNNEKKAPGLKKAYESMKACPIAFSHPSEAQQLHGIGPKLVEQLTQAMNEYCVANGLPMPEKPRGARKRATAAAVGDHIADQHARDEEALDAPNKRRRTAAPRTYVPQFRSGGWALLYALFEAEEEAERERRRKNGITKEDLIERAQQHCDASFEAPADTSKFYTAWNSMKTLMGRNYVYVRSQPKRYLLTDIGIEVAQGIFDTERAKERGNDAVLDLDAPPPPPPRGNGRAASAGRDAARAILNMPGSWEEDGDQDAAGKGKEKEKSPVPLRRVASVAARSINSNALFDSIDVFSSDEELTAEDRLARQRAERLRMQRAYADVPEEYGASRMPSDGRNKEVPRAVEGAIWGALSREKADRRTAAFDLGDDGFVVGRTVASTSRAGSSARHVPIEIINDDSDGASGSRTTANTSRTSTGNSTATSSGSVTYIPTFAPFTPAVFRANTFSVELILDNREVRSKADRTYIQNGLTDAQATPTVRKLEVGDAMWIARSYETGQELVLDYIVERKRLDDLVSSIKDGRFHEQKFRLTKSGLKNVIYIIEEYSLRDGLESMLESVETAISSTQVVNGFFVKRTAKLDDTIRYLARMTKMLRTLYMGKDLHLIPDSHVESHTFAQLKEHIAEAFPGKKFYLRYETFSQLVSKSASMTLRDLFLKMLMCVRGISAEKALEIERSFATPAALIEAFQRCRDEAERESLVMNASSNAVLRRRVGAAVSRRVKEVWWGEK